MSEPAKPEQCDTPLIFVISLSDAAIRRKPLVDGLRNQGFKVRIHKAVDGRHGLPTEYEPMLDRKLAAETIGREPTDAELACALSHVSVYQTMVKEGVDDAVVLEDDAILVNGFGDVVRTPMPDWADLILFDHKNCFVSRLWDQVPLVSVTARKVAFRTPTLATGYRINGDAAKRMTQMSLPIHQLADWPDSILTLRTYALEPRVVDHSDPDSGHSHLREQRARQSSPDEALNSRTRAARRFLQPSYWHRKLVFTRIS